MPAILRVLCARSCCNYEGHLTRFAQRLSLLPLETCRVSASLRRTSTVHRDIIANTSTTVCVTLARSCPQRSSGKTVVTGPNLVRNVPSFLSRIRFSIPSACRFHRISRSRSFGEGRRSRDASSVQILYTSPDSNFTSSVSEEDSLSLTHGQSC